MGLTKANIKSSIMTEEKREKIQSELGNSEPRFLLNTSRLLQFGTLRPIPEGARIIYFSDAFDALSRLIRPHSY